MTLVPLPFVRSIEVAWGARLDGTYQTRCPKESVHVKLKVVQTITKGNYGKAYLEYVYVDCFGPNSGRNNGDHFSSLGHFSLWQEIAYHSKGSCHSNPRSIPSPRRMGWGAWNHSWPWPAINSATSVSVLVFWMAIVQGMLVLVPNHVFGMVPQMVLVEFNKCVVSGKTCLSMQPWLL